LITFLNYPGESYPDQEQEKKDNRTKTGNKQQPVIKVEPFEGKWLKKKDKQKNTKTDT
jgi:hypothetical protein